MGKNQSASNLTNIIKQDASGSIAFMHGNTMLMSVSSSGAIATTGNVAGTASYASNADLLDGLDSTVFTLTSSFAAQTASFTAFTASQNILNGTYATTGSNTFRGSQYISSSFVPTNFTDTASLYTDGGLRVTRNAYLSSSLYVNGDLIIFGSQSVNYISSSQLDIADNIITVNTSTPTLRFGGLAVKDSGSLATGLTGSILWDSQDNQWIYSNPSGSEFDSAVFLVGPRNYGTIGNEVGITTNALAKGDGLHHMTSSGIFESGSRVGIGTSSPSYALDVNNNGTNIGIRLNQPSSTTSYYNTIYFTGNHTSVVSYIGTGGSTTANTALRDAYYLGTYTAHPIVFTTSDTGRMYISASGLVGIGTASPNNLLSVRGNADFGATATTNPILSQYGALTFPRGQIFFSNTNTQNQLYIVSNGYSNSSGVFAYRNSSQPAVGMGFDAGGLSILTAGNGTADATISWNTQMVIDNTGVYYTNTLTPINLKPENTPATVITNLASAAATYNYKPGVYWVGYGGYTFLAYVRFNWHQGRNWVLALKCHNTHDMTSGNPLWQNNTLINQSDFNLQSGRMAKYAAWNYFPFTRLLYEMGNRIPPIMQWNSQKTSLYSVFSAITPSNGSGVGPDSTDPQISTSVSTTYYGMTNFLGSNFTDFGGSETIINYYGLGSFANNSNNSTSAANTGISSGFGLTTEHLGTFSSLQSTGRSGAWIGAPMDEAAAYFNRASSAGADSGFGLGVAGGNNARTTTSGIISWALGNSVANFLPAYVWLSID